MPQLLVALVVFALTAVGCAPYRSMPLSRAAARAALATPADQTENLRTQLTPEQAAVMAVLYNPSLRGERDRRALAQAQVLQAGILPNPQLNANVDPVTGGNTTDTVTGYGVGVSWEVTSLIGRNARIAAAQASARSIELDIGWQEWQIAEAAKKAAYDVVALRAQLAESEAAYRRFDENLAVVRRAVDAHQKTIVELAAAETAARQAHSEALARRQELLGQQLMLNELLGLPPATNAMVSADVALPSDLALPAEAELTDLVEARRLDLLALERGYESQEQTLRAAVLSQFPKVNLGFTQASDTTNVHTSGFGVTIDLPIFDRNQGNIAIEQATRQKLFDEYASRVFEARSAIAQSYANIRSLSEQIADTQMSIPVLENLARLYGAGVEQHSVDILSYYAAQNDVTAKRIDLLKLQQQLIENQIALELAAGRFLPAPHASRPTSATETVQ